MSEFMIDLGLIVGLGILLIAAAVWTLCKVDDWLHSGRG